MSGFLDAPNAKSGVVNRVQTEQYYQQSYKIWDDFRGPLSQYDGTSLYLDFGDPAGVGTYRAGFSNVASGASAVSRWQLPIGSSGGRNTTIDYGASYVKPSSEIEDTRSSPTNTEAAAWDGDFFQIRRFGMTQVVVWLNGYASGTNSKGLIYYGNNTDGQTSYVRTNYGAYGRTQYSADTDTTDNWAVMSNSDNHTQAAGMRFTCFGEDASDGSVYIAENGNDWVKKVSGGIANRMESGHFGLWGDGHNDNESNHTILMAAWVRGVAPIQLLKDEFKWVTRRWHKATWATNAE